MRKLWKGKRVLSVLMSVMLAVPAIAGVPGGMDQVQAATLNNPRISGDTVTWDCVYFGRYVQSTETTTKSDAIKWRVLSVNGNDAFLLADVNLDVVNYHTDEEVTWETSVMRSYLNSYGYTMNSATKDFRANGFFTKAFTYTEQSAVMEVDVANDANPVNTDVSNGSSTNDKVFLLSCSEANNPAYGLAANSSRIRLNTAYVGAGGFTRSEHVKAAGQPGAYWLRTMGATNYTAVCVGEDGQIYYDGNYVVTEMIAICPAIHLDLSNSELWSYAGTVSNDGTSTAGDNPPKVDTSEKPLIDTQTDAVYIETEDAGVSGRTVEFRESGENAETVNIPDTIYLNNVPFTVTSIADNAFKNNKKIKKVVIGDTVKKIGKNAFSGCSNLKTVKMGKNVTTIGDKAFYGCKKLSKITLPSQVKKVGKQAFAGCKKLKKITVKTSNLTKKNVGAKAFKGIHKKAVFKVPKASLSTYKGLFKSKGAGSKTKVK